MTATLDFEVGEAGAPRLDGDAEPEGQPDEGRADVGGPVVVMAWTPDEVNAAIQQWWNLGCLWFGPSWQARAEELRQVSILLAPYFDQWFPKGTGQDPGLVMVALACVGTGVTMALQRGPLVAQHWRKPWFVQQLQAAQQAQAAQAPREADGAGPAPPEPRAGAAAPAEASSSSYKLPRDLAAVVAPGSDDSLASHGI